MARSAARKRPNLRNVAARAGVSVATVSRVLNTPERVAPDTRKRVEAAIRDLNFIPSAAARAINRGHSGMVAALLPTLDNAIYARVVNGLETGFAARDLSLMVAQTHDDLETELHRARHLVQIGAEALILVGVTHHAELFSLLDQTRIPTLAVSCFDPDSRLVTIGYDNAEAACQAADHLLSLGHRRIAVLHGPVDRNDRMRSRRTALQAREDAVDYSFFEVPLSMEGGHLGVSQVLQIQPRPTAILCFSDIIAHGALNGLQSLGVCVPGEMSVMGMEDLPGSRFTAPSLTSLRLSVEEMGICAAEAVAEWLEQDARPTSVKLPTALVARGSTALLKRGV